MWTNQYVVLKSHIKYKKYANTLEYINLNGIKGNWNNTTDWETSDSW